MSGPAVRPGEGGALLRVRAAPGAARDAITGLHGDALRVRVRAAPERGRANRALARLLAGALGVAPSAVAVARGEAGRDKWVLVRGMPADELRAKLQAILVTLGPP